MLSFDYDALQREITNIDNTDDDYCDNEILESNEDVQENLSGEAEFDMEVPKEIKSKVTPCVIVDNENNEEKIERCNHMDNNNRSIHNLIGCFEIDSNVVREVGKEVEKLGVCLKHLNLDQNKFHRPIEGESHRKKHKEDSTSSLRLIARWINNVASSNNNDTKNNLLNLLINKVIGDFNTTETKATLPSSSTVIGSSDNLLIPSFFHLNIALAVKNVNMNEDEENSQLDSKTFKNYGEILANSIWQTRNIIKENKLPLEEPESLDEFYEAIPKNLTSFFNSLITNLYEKKHEIVKKKQKQLNLPETEIKYPLIKKITTFLTSTVQVASHSKRHEYRVRNERISNIVPASRLEIGPNIWNLAVIDNIDIRDHTYSYGNIFDVTCNIKHAVVRIALQYKLPHPVGIPIDDSEQILPEPIFSGQFANEWVVKYDDVFSTLYEENNRDFGIERINESIRKYIKPGHNLPTPNLVILQGGPEANSNDNVYESCDMYLYDFVQVERERMLTLYDEIVDESNVLRRDRKVNEHKEAMWGLVDELLKTFESILPERSILLKETTQLTREGYQRLFTSYEKGVVRLKKIIEQDIDLTEPRTTTLEN
ncbi:3315_t:CDS:2 [Entrophospora sp. SA101]|nr:3315_t:CDS:2 [Entrophospora sp. SA101]